MKLKVCGMRDQENIQQIGGLDIDFMGFIFYNKSPRFIKNEIDFSAFPSSIEKVGVFVNADLDYILNKVKQYKLDYVQFHGKESIELCRSLKSRHIGVIKAFPIDGELPTIDLIEYQPHIDYFLFDTKTPNYGGSGVKFNWDLLKNYALPTPYFLSGGIRPEDIAVISLKRLPGLHAIDINSGVEVSPGLKAFAKVQEIKKMIDKDI